MCCISMLVLERPSRAYKRTPACIAPRILNERAFPRCPGNGVRAVGYVIFNMSKRLSATDISALASMKNVAKCDTWCELQNPVNHRVFERKLRPKPLGRGHACLGVTRRCPPKPLGSWAGRMMASRVLCHAVGIKISPRRLTPRQSVVVKPLLPIVCACRARAQQTMLHRFVDAFNATPGQAGLPAEFKHINKRRKRNLQGFP